MTQGTPAPTQGHAANTPHVQGALAYRLPLLAGLISLAACAETAGSQDVALAAPLRPAPEGATYQPVQTRLLDGDLVQFLVTMSGARDEQDVILFSRCAAAQYALIRGYGFARHLRTNVEERGGNLRADAVYTVSPSLPRGARTIDAEVTVDACTDQGIPTV